jgi:hypothetical protein
MNIAHFFIRAANNSIHLSPTVLLHESRGGSGRSPCDIFWLACYWSFQAHALLRRIAIRSKTIAPNPIRAMFRHAATPRIDERVFVGLKPITDTSNASGLAVAAARGRF